MVCKKFQFDSKYKRFLFSDDETFNVFNLLRLFRDYKEEDNLEIDICSLDKSSQ